MLTSFNFLQHHIICNSFYTHQPCIQFGTCIIHVGATYTIVLYMYKAILCLKTGSLDDATLEIFIVLAIIGYGIYIYEPLFLALQTINIGVGYLPILTVC